MNSFLNVIGKELKWLLEEKEEHLESGVHHSKQAAQQIPALLMLIYVNIFDQKSIFYSVSRSKL